MLGKFDESRHQGLNAYGRQGRGCNQQFVCLLTAGYPIRQVVVNATTCLIEETLCTKLNSAAREFIDNAKGMAGGTEKEISMIIDGEALETALYLENALRLLSFPKLCCAMICNRVSPAQKPMMVKLVRDNITSVWTLAICNGTPS